MSRKSLVWIGIGMLVAAYAIYATFFLKRIAIGDACEASAACAGECLAMGGLGAYAKSEVCTKQCSAPTDCPAPTSCTSIDITVVNPKKGASKEKRSYCLREGSAAK